MFDWSHKDKSLKICDPQTTAQIFVIRVDAMPPDSVILVTGGAGYVGSHVVWALHDQGHRPVVLDCL